jgi:hypothetical protein
VPSGGFAVDVVVDVTGKSPRVLLVRIVVVVSGGLVSGGALASGSSPGPSVLVVLVRFGIAVVVTRPADNTVVEGLEAGAEVGAKVGAKVVVTVGARVAYVGGTVVGGRVGATVLGARVTGVPATSGAGMVVGGAEVVGRGGMVGRLVGNVAWVTSPSPTTPPLVRTALTTEPLGWTTSN